MPAQLLALPTDINCLILSHLGTYHREQYEIDRPSLARVARTCRQLSSPAVAILWRVLPTFTPLICTLPADLFEIRTPGSKYQKDDYVPLSERFEIDRRPCPHLLRDPCLADFERWIVYAHFVHIINNSIRKMNSPFPHDFWTTLTRHSPNPLLPNVYRVRLSGSEGRFLARNPFPLPFAKSLLHLQLLFFPPRTDMLRILTNLAQASLVRLQVLDLMIDTVGELGEERDAAGIEVIDGPLVDCVLQLSSLRKLRVQGIPISSAAIAAIGSLHCLEDLSITASSSSTPLDGDIGTFPFINALEVKIDWLPWVTAFLRHVSSARLEKILVHCHRADSHDIADFYSLLGQHYSRLAIRKIELSSTSELPCYSPEALRPLLQFPYLAVLSMKGWHSFDIDDSFIAEIARACPELEVLELDPLQESTRFYILRRTPPRATLAGLATLAERCRRLRSIKLAVNTDVDLPSLATQRPVSESQVQTLHVGLTGPPRDPVQVAMFLSEHFPLLDDVDFYPRRMDGDRTLREWNEVGDFLFQLWHIRRQERAWAEQVRFRRSGARCELAEVS